MTPSLSVSICKMETTFLTFTIKFGICSRLDTLSHACRATQDGQVMLERSDRMWSTGEGNGKQLQYSFLENPMNSRKRQNDRILKEELPRSVGAQYTIGDQ